MSCSCSMEATPHRERKISVRREVVYWMRKICFRNVRSHTVLTSQSCSPVLLSDFVFAWKGEAWVPTKLLAEAFVACLASHSCIYTRHQVFCYCRFDAACTILLALLFVLGELKVNLWDYIGIIIPPKQLKVIHSTTTSPYRTPIEPFSILNPNAL